MSQPPVPPQPPQGWPPPQPGPQQYPAAPQPQPPYPPPPGPGYPPPQGGAHPPYPYPQTPPHGPAPTGPGGGRRRLSVIIGALVVALLVIAAGAFALLRDTDDSEQSDGRPNDTATSAAPKPTGVQGRELFKVAAPEVADGELLEAPGSWVTSRYYASGAKDAVTGYALSTGKLAWTVELSGGLCAVSHDITRSGLVAVVFHASKDGDSACSRFAVIDVNKGAKAWEKPIKDGDIGRGAGLSVAISDTTAAAGWPGGSLAYQASSGALLWDAPAKGCTQEEPLGGRQLLTLAWCHTGADMGFRVGTRDQQGKATWTYTVPKAKGAWLVSSNPLVLGLLQSDDGLEAEQLVTVSAQGEVESTIDLGDDYIAGCGDGGTCNATVVTGHTAYLGSDPHSYSKANQITAFDLHTGKPVRSFKAPGVSILVPVRADGDALIAIQRATVSTAARVLRLDAGTGKSTTLLQLPDDLDINSTLHSMISQKAKDPLRYEDGRLFLHRSSGFYAHNESPMTLAYTNQ